MLSYKLLKELNEIIHVKDLTKYLTNIKSLYKC